MVMSYCVNIYNTSMVGDRISQVSTKTMKSLETHKISIGIGTEIIIALALETHSHTQHYLGKSMVQSTYVIRKNIFSTKYKYFSIIHGK